MKVLKFYALCAATTALFALTKNEAELHKAAAAGDVKKVQALAKKFDKKKDSIDAIGSERDANTERSGWTALYLAGVRGHTEVVKVLLSAGADPAGRIDEGFGDTHCFLADLREQPEVLELFLKAKGASACGDMFLHSATDKSLAARLLSGGLDANATVLDSPLLLRAVEDGRAALVQLLIANKADVNYRIPKDSIFEERRGKSILDIAKETGNAQVIELLRKAGAK